MKAYHGGSRIKAKYLKRVQAHRAADEIKKGKYWEGGKGCAIGCTIHSSNHRSYETKLGIPTALARLEDTLFERMSNAEAKNWPVDFLKAIPVGADLSQVADRFMLWLLVDPQDGVLRYAKTDGIKTTIKNVAAAVERRISGEQISREQWQKLRVEAWETWRTRAAYAAAVYAYADADARYKFIVRMAKKLLELLREAKNQ